MEVSRALADLEEVRSRLAAVQRFRGLSGGAAIASGIVATVAGAIQYGLIAHPQVGDRFAYLAIWATCLALSLGINYGAILWWLVHNWTVRSRVELRTVGMTILPAIVVGGLLTVALAIRGDLGILPGVWCLCYALGLFASRAMTPAGVSIVAAAFAAYGTALVFAQGDTALAWWVMPLTFGIGQCAIGCLIFRDDLERAAVAA